MTFKIEDKILFFSTKVAYVNSISKKRIIVQHKYNQTLNLSVSMNHIFITIRLLHQSSLRIVWLVSSPHIGVRVLDVFYAVTHIPLGQYQLVVQF